MRDKKLLSKSFLNGVFFKKHKGILKNFFFVFVLNIIQKVLGLATIYVLVRALDKTQFGEYQFILSVVGLLTIFSLPGVSNAIMQSTARGCEGVFRESARLAFLSSLIGSLILCGIALWYFLTKENAPYIAFYAAAGLFPFVHGLKHWKAIIAGRERFSLLLVIDGLVALLTALLLISVVLIFPGSIVLPLFIVLCVPSLQNLIMTCYLFKKIDNKAPIENGCVQYGIKTTFYSSLNIVANNIDKLLIYNFFSPASLASYYAAERIAELTKGISQNLASALAPRFAKTKSYTERLDKTLNFLSAVLGAGIIFFAFTLLPWLLTILFGEEYIEAIPYAQALLCTVAIGNHASFRNRFVNSKLDEKSNRDITISISLIRIVASAIFVPLFGILGAVLSTFIYRIGTVLILEFIIVRRYRKPDLVSPSNVR